MELLEAISKRRAIRAYTDKKVSESKLEMVLKAGCAAPVGRSLYEKMHITVIQEESLLKEISNVMKLNMHIEDDPLYNASTLIIVSAAKMPYPGIEIANAACILENMMLEATEQDLGSVIIWGSGVTINYTTELKQKVGIPDGYSVIAGIVIGEKAMEVEPKKLTFSIKINRV